jgi:hypothetical protein
MITYNGIELDYRADTLQSLIIKGGLTKIDNLTDRTGTSSTQFNLPRTAKNELAFGNITTEGSELTTSGSAFITLEGNIFSQGVLYVQGYDQDNFKCLFMGADNNLIKNLRNKPLWTIFPKEQYFVFTDANIKTALQSEITKTLGQDITYHYGNPFLADLASINSDTSAPFFNVKSLVYKILYDEGYTLVSNFFNSDYGLSLDYSDFNGTQLSSNGFNDSGEQVPTSQPSATIYLYTYPDVQYLDLGTALAGNTSITEGTFANGKKYILSRDISKLKIRGKINCTLGDLEEAQFFIDIWNSFGVNSRYSTNQLTDFGNNLQEGVNNFALDLDYDFVAGEIITFGTYLKTDKTYPLNGSSIVIESCTISHDNIQQGDAISFKDYISEMTQLDFLKGLLKQFNLVLDIKGSNAYIELQDSGVEPIGSNPATLPSISTEQYNLTDIVSEDTITTIEYLQSDLIFLKQKISNNSYTETIQLLPNQSYGSYLFKLNTFNNTNVETVESFFNGLYDSDSRHLRDDNFVKQYSFLGNPPTSWEKVLSSRFSYTGYDYNLTDAEDYINADTTTSTLNVLVNWSEPAMIGKVYDGLFKETLLQKKNNKIIEVIFRDELGTIVSNRKEYIYKDQVYKIVEWNYDIIKKLVKAKLIMK